MSDRALLIERLQTVLAAIERIPDRFASITEPADFLKDKAGLEHMDSICMVLIAAGEEFKKIDRDTRGELFARYPDVQWRRAIGLRDVLAHGYFDVDPVQVFAICSENIPGLIETLKRIIRDLELGVAP